ncbi:peptidoglycan-binding domain-containing protein [Microlunatus flavus]|uniref:ARB-07466-like C-terminal domain-containing protein n=1 Tax=Microlunatus flavus TaxID=1036181 RepID=A0A1H9LAU2_9ACTN|nr:peptidoglycan-binding domain-containing protein [Microlunatus flavus]SER08602.1 hypothetical protein SAMN05421756_108238 [Microlunatus flavus]
MVSTLPSRAPRRRGLPQLVVAGLVALALGLGLQAGAPSAPASAVPKPPPAASVPDGIEDLAAYVPANSCTVATRPGTAALGSLLVRTYPRTSFGGARACGASPNSEHHDGRAVDWMNSVRDTTQKKQAQAVVDWLLAPDEQGRPYANARRLGVMYVIWDNHIWGAYRPSEGWREYDGCAAKSKQKKSLDAACHRNHMHLSLSWAGAMGTTSYWTGQVAAPDYGRCRPADMSWAYGYKQPNPKPCPRVGTVKAPKGSSTTMKTLVTYSGRSIRKGDRFAAVKAVQKTIGAKQSGTWSSASVKKLKTFQTWHDLDGTGKLSYATWRALMDAQKP